MLHDVPYEAKPAQPLRAVARFIIVAVCIATMMLIFGTYWPFSAQLGVLLAFFAIAIPFLVIVLADSWRRHRYFSRRNAWFAGGSAAQYARHLLAIPNRNDSELVETVVRETWARAAAEGEWGKTLRIAESGDFEPVEPFEHVFEPRQLGDQLDDAPGGDVRKTSAAETAVRLRRALPRLAMLIGVGLLGLALFRSAINGSVFAWVLLPVIAGAAYGRLFALFRPGAHRARQSGAAFGPPPNHAVLRPEAELMGEWWLVPAGIAIRTPRGTGAEIALFKRSESVATMARHHRWGQEWRVTLARRDGRWAASQLTPEALEGFLQAWLSPAAPPDADRLSDLT